MNPTTNETPLSQYEVPQLDWKIIGSYVAGNLLILLILFSSIKEPIARGDSISFVSILIYVLIVGGWIAANYFIIKHYQNRTQSIEIYEDKIIIKKQKGSRAVSFQEMKGVSWNFYKVTKGKSTKVVTELIVDLEEEKLTFLSDLLPKVEELGELLEQKMTEKYLEEYVTKIRDGEKVSFGIVELDLEGFSFHEHSFSWSILGALSLDGGNLIVINKDEEPIAILPQNQLLNIQLLAVLATQLIQATEELEEEEEVSEDDFLDEEFVEPLFD